MNDDAPDFPPPDPASSPAAGARATPTRRTGAPRTGDTVPRMETVRITAPDLHRRAALEKSRTRLVFTAAGFAVLFLAVAGKLTVATIIHPLKPHRPEPPVQKLVAQKTLDTAPLVRRATITDRNGQILAVSLPTLDVFADPRQVIDPALDARKLKAVLPQIDQAQIQDRLSASTKQFVYIARRVTPQQEVAVNNLGLPGVDFQTGEERHYPMGRVAAQVLGGTDTDENGVAGVEKWFNKRLMTDPAPLRLSLDVRVQAVVRDAVQNVMTEFQALGGAGIVMNVNTGEILAMVSLPDYDTADIGTATPDERFNRAVAGAYEPGSVFKLQTAAMALDDGVINIWDKFDTVHPIHIGRFTITDFEPEHMDMELPHIIAVSSNIGASHIAMDVGAERQRAWLQKLGFFKRSPIQLPESAPPILHPASSWRMATTMTVSFGNGIAVTPAQLVAGTAALIDGGVWHPATLLALPPGEQPMGIRVEKPSTSDIMRKLMRLVVTNGTGTPARVPGYLVGAKTGTSQKVGKGGYRQHTNLSSMVAAFPMNDPKYMVFVWLDSPHGNKSTYGFSTGGWTAGPAVKEIISQIGPMLGIMPFQQPELGQLQATLSIPLDPPRPPGAPPPPTDAIWAAQHPVREPKDKEKARPVTVRYQHRPEPPARREAFAAHPDVIRASAEAPLAPR